MFKSNKFIFVCFLSFCFSFASFAKEQRDWSQTTDFGKLREDIGWSDTFFELCELNRPLRKIQQHMSEQQWDEAVGLGKAWLESCPIDIGVHFNTGISLTNLNKEVEANHHFQWMKGLMDSILASGDGDTPETALVVVSVAEEYDYLSISGLRPTNQSLVQGKTMLDAITAETRDGREFTVYFNPAAHFQRVSKIVDKMNKK